MQKRIWTEAQEHYIRRRLETDKIKLYVLSQELHIDYSTLRAKVKTMGINYRQQDLIAEQRDFNTFRSDNALPPGHPLTWGLICPGIDYPDPYKFC